MNPFTEISAESAGALGETQLIAAIREWLGEASPPPPAGIGDDCAVFAMNPRSQGLVTTDPVLWRRHFDEAVSPEEAAGKVFKRNLSDIAAMGGRPTVAVVSLLLPPSTSMDWLERFYNGLRTASQHYQVPVAGGDVSQTDGLLGACMTLIGETTGSRALTRNGASAGDRLLVTGSLGGSRLRNHFDFEPRLREGQWLASRPEVVAAMDVSDGLAKDLLALIPNDCDAELSTAEIPISRDAYVTAETSGRPALHHALCDGEDHELLLAVKGKADLAALLRDWNEEFDLALTPIGVLRRRDPKEKTFRIHLPGLPPEVMKELRGYEHFR